MSLSEFTVDQHHVQAVLEQLEPEPSIAKLTYNLAAEQSVQQPLSSDLRCVICFDVVLRPKVCSDCDRLYCGACIEKWTAQNKTCPHCKNRFRAGKMNLVVKNILDETEFRCDIADCNAVFTY